MAENLPAAQVVHAVPMAFAAEPEAHTEQCCAPLCEKVPGVQSLHLTALELDWYLPESQGKHELTPEDAEYMPPAQARQFVEPVDP